jgi:signal peptidase I
MDEEKNNGDNNENADVEIPEIQITREMADAEYFAPVEENRRVVEYLFDWVEIFSSAFMTVILLFTFILRLVTVQGPSMQETLHEKDNLIISHLLFSPKQGDIVVIQVPNPQYDTPIIKRVIATEGQTVDFDFDNWVVIVDGEPIDEPYANYDYMTNVNGEPLLRPMNNYDIQLNSLPVTVEQGRIFVMGDNRNRSSDSRDSKIGQVDVRNVVGRVLVRVFPLDKFGVVKPNAG